MTGGSSAINGQVFLRGIPEDYDDWVERGNDEWSFQKLVPYFNMVETDNHLSGRPGGLPWLRRADYLPPVSPGGVAAGEPGLVRGLARRGTSVL